LATTADCGIPQPWCGGGGDAVGEQKGTRRRRRRRSCRRRAPGETDAGVHQLHARHSQFCSATESLKENHSSPPAAWFP